MQGVVGGTVEGSGDLITTEILTYRKVLIDNISGVVAVNPGKKKVWSKRTLELIVNCQILVLINILLPNDNFENRLPPSKIKILPAR